jgi:hypothetical protein
MKLDDNRECPYDFGHVQMRGPSIAGGWPDPWTNPKTQEGLRQRVVAEGQEAFIYQRDNLAWRHSTKGQGENYFFDVALKRVLFSWWMQSRQPKK